DAWGGAGQQSDEKGASRELDRATSAEADDGGGAPPAGPGDDVNVSNLDDTDDGGSYGSDGSSYSGSDGIDGTSPAIIAQVSELLNFVYGKTSVAGQIDRVSTIMRAYEGREAVLLELLETKALIKANADSSASGDLPASLRNNAGLNSNRSREEEGDGDDAAGAAEGAPSSDRKVVPPTPVSVLTTPTVLQNSGPASPATVNSPRSPRSPSGGTMSTFGTAGTSASKKKKKLFGFSFGSSKNSKKDKVSRTPARSKAGKAAKKGKAKKTGRKGQQLTDDGSI
ncbi:hypothetical protein THAOC_18893, partial [Thalassiosira oceanica]